MGVPLHAPVTTVDRPRPVADERPYLSVVIAAYNEAAIIERTLQRVVAELQTRPGVVSEVILVNDGSRDETGRIAEAFAADEPRILVVHHVRNFGQGRALRTGFDRARGDVVVTLDADLSYGPEYIFRMADALEAERVDIVLASAYAKGGTVENVPFHRHMLSRLGNFYLARMSPYRVSTSTCVVRAYRREALEGLFLTADGMELQLEILMKARVDGLRVHEIPARLAWTDEKAVAAEFARVSKMRILRTIPLYLLLGWISRPAIVAMVAALLLIVPTFYSMLVLVVRLFELIAAQPTESIFEATSLGLQALFDRYSYAISIYGIGLLFGIQIFCTALLSLQNKFYYEETQRHLNALWRAEKAAGRRLDDER
jgi:glycosyltransferase involved in cell wall biosynthesis